MTRTKISFPNEQGHSLAGLLEAPVGSVRAWALFAHCFTCGKDIAAASRISRSLTREGIGVLRFDFTGLGNSDGDFANTNFSSNLDDLRAAARWLTTAHGGPQVLVGHSLGGAAVLSIAAEIETAVAVCTIGAPARAQHVEHLFSDARAEIDTAGCAMVRIGLREFPVRRQMLQDLARHASTEHIGRLRKALLVLHSPVDDVVPVEEAARIYAAARHPKSFVSLDQADHLLRKPADAEYVARLIAAWVERYLPARVMPTALEHGQVEVAENGAGRFGNGIRVGTHLLAADEPIEQGGKDSGPSPYDLLLAALGACTSMTLRMYAERKSLALEQVRVLLRHRRMHAADCEDCETREGQITEILRTIHLEGELSPSERERLLQIADRCPVHRTLEGEIRIRTQEGGAE